MKSVIGMGAVVALIFLLELGFCWDPEHGVVFESLKSLRYSSVRHG